MGVCLRSLTSHSQPVMQIRWSGERPDLGGVVYSAGRDCVIKVWNPKDGAMLSPGETGPTLVSRNGETEPTLGSVESCDGKMAVVIWQANRDADETNATLLDLFSWISKPMKGKKRWNLKGTELVYYCY